MIIDVGVAARPAATRVDREAALLRTAVAQMVLPCLDDADHAAFSQVLADAFAGTGSAPEDSHTLAHGQSHSHTVSSGNGVVPVPPNGTPVQAPQFASASKPGA